MSPRHFTAGRAADVANAHGEPVRLTPEDCGWRYSGLRVLTLGAGASISIETGEFEAFVLPLSGSFTVLCDGDAFELRGRHSVFTRVTDFAYVPRDATVTIASATGGEVALPMAKARVRLTARYGPAESVAIETRGAGPATRQVTNFGSPEQWPYADRLMAVELLTPGGNWSSYPPHKHDDTDDSGVVCSVRNEEIYYFRIAGPDGRAPSPTGFGLHRTYTADGTIDDDVCVRDGDVYVVPRGYHGPCVAAPGYTMYYLNVLAGDGDTTTGERSMAFCDDPAHHWVRDSWVGMATDPRVPMTSIHEAKE